MRKKMKTNMKQAISNVLELMFFISIQFKEEGGLPDGRSPRDQTSIMATLGFSGPVSGSYYLLIPVAMAKEITANFLGLGEEEVSTVQERDTVKEALNMIGGHMLSLTDQPDGYQLGIPEIISEADSNTCAKENDNAIYFEAGEHCMTAGVVLN